MNARTPITNIYKPHAPFATPRVLSNWETRCFSPVLISIVSIENRSTLGNAVTNVLAAGVTVSLDTFGTSEELSRVL